MVDKSRKDNIVSFAYFTPAVYRLVVTLSASPRNGLLKSQYEGERDPI